MRLAATLLTLAACGAAAHATAPRIRAVDLGGLEARSAALLLSGQEAGDLEASFLARTIEQTPGGATILVVADLVGASLLDAAGPGGSEMIVELYAYALDGAGQPRANLTRAFRLDLRAHRARLETGGVKFLGSLRLPGGATAASLRLLVLHRASGRLALRGLPVSPLAVTAERPGPAAPLLVLEPDGAWLVAADDGRPAAASRDDRIPATRLVATAGSSLPLVVTADDPAAVTGRLLTGDGRPLDDAALGEDRPAVEALAGGGLALRLSGLPPGSYLLEIDGGGGAEPPLRLPLELVPAQLAAGTPWFGRPAADEPELSPGSLDPPAVSRSALAQRALAAYHRAFELWLAGDVDQALAVMRRFETEATAAGNAVALSIEEGQVRAAAELVAGNGEALVPLMGLHELLFRSYQQHGGHMLANHSQRLAGEFARLYAARGGREEGRIAALVQVSLAGWRQEIGTRIAAQATFERALELDPRQPEALLALAALHESFAHYDTAVELLQRLERAGAMSPPARIRLAVNLGRMGSERPALRLLRELTAAEPEWVSRLAYQEWARLLTGTGRAAEALPVLVEARERYPDDQALTLQQAALLDKLGKPLAGQRVLAAIDDLTGDRGESPRLRYSALPSQQITAARARLTRAAVDRLPEVLATAGKLRGEAAP